jgi:hypothetical protein
MFKFFKPRRRTALEQYEAVEKDNIITKYLFLIILL